MCWFIVTCVLLVCKSWTTCQQSIAWGAHVCAFINSNKFIIYPNGFCMDQSWLLNQCKELLSLLVGSCPYLFSQQHSGNSSVKVHPCCWHVHLQWRLQYILGMFLLHGCVIIYHPCIVWFYNVDSLTNENMVPRTVLTPRSFRRVFIVSWNDSFTLSFTSVVRGCTSVTSFPL